MKKGRVTIKTKKASGWGRLAKGKIYGYEVCIGGVPVIFEKTKARANMKANEIKKVQGKNKK